MIASCRLVDDAAALRADPVLQRLQSCPVVGEAFRLAIAQAMGVEMIFRDVDADGIIHDLFVSRSCHTRQGCSLLHYLFGFIKRAGVIHLENGPQRPGHHRSIPRHPSGRCSGPRGGIRIARIRMPGKSNRQGHFHGRLPGGSWGAVGAERGRAFIEHHLAIESGLGGGV